MTHFLINAAKHVHQFHASASPLVVCVLPFGVLWAADDEIIDGKRSDVAVIDLTPRVMRLRSFSRSARTEPSD
jgi:hypothetical protein